MSSRVTRAVATIAALILSAALASAFGPGLLLRAFPTDDQRALERVFRSAIETEQRTQSRVASVDGHTFTGADLDRQHVLDERALATFIADGPLLRKDLQIADQVHRDQVAAHRSVTGPWVEAGIDSIAFANVDPGTTNGSLDADVEVWFNDRGFGRTPGTSRDGTAGHNGLHFQANLVRGSTGVWLVESYTVRFIPGEGP